MPHAPGAGRCAACEHHPRASHDTLASPSHTRIAAPAFASVEQLKGRVVQVARGRRAASRGQAAYMAVHATVVTYEWSRVVPQPPRTTDAVYCGVAGSQPIHVRTGGCPELQSDPTGLAGGRWRCGHGMSSCSRCRTCSQTTRCVRLSATCPPSGGGEKREGSIGPERARCRAGAMRARHGCIVPVSYMPSKRFAGARSSGAGEVELNARAGFARACGPHRGAPLRMCPTHDRVE